MSDCRRNGISYKRHKMTAGRCVKCGAISVPAEQIGEIVDKLVANAVSSLEGKQ